MAYYALYALDQTQTRFTLNKFMKYLYNIIFYQPIYNLLIWLYSYIPDLGVAIIVLTFIIKLILYPFSKQALHAQKNMQEIQPKMEALKVKYKGDQTGLSKAMMDLYKTEKVNPFSSCLPVLIQFPFLIAVYQALHSGMGVAQTTMLYPFVHAPATMNNLAFGFLDLTQKNVVLAVLAALSQYWQTKMLMNKKPPMSEGVPAAKDESMTATMNKQMMYMMPIMTLFIGISLPSGLVLYWLVITLLSVAQQWWMFRGVAQRPTTSN